MPATPFSLFLSRELRNNKAFQKGGQGGVALKAWFTELASHSVRPEDLDEMLLVASALPLPSNRKERQQALELAGCMFPSRALWSKRSHPREQVQPGHEGYWSRVDALLRPLLQDPAIDPLAPVSWGPLRSRIELGKRPLALVLMHAGLPHLLENCVATLPQDFRAEAIDACARFNQIALGEQLLAHWDPQDVEGAAAARDTLWMGSSLRQQAGTLVLPQSDPPLNWWTRCLRQDAIPAAERVARERPTLAWHLTNAHLRTGRMEDLLAVRLRGGLDARANWLMQDGVELPVWGMLTCGYVQECGERVFEHSRAQEFGARLNLIRSLLPAAHEALPASQSWKQLARWIFAAGEGKGSHWEVDTPPGQALGQVRELIAPWMDLGLQGAQGLPAPWLLRPLCYATLAAARHDDPDPSTVLRAYLATTLPWLRQLGALRSGMGVLEHAQANAFNQALELLVQLPKLEKGGPRLPSGTAHVEVEVLLWKAAFERLSDKGARPSFPNSMGAARGTWDGIRNFLQAGAKPQWSVEDAKVLLLLTQYDKRMPDDIRSLVEVEALREDRAFAPGKPRRI